MSSCFSRHFHDISENFDSIWRDRSAHFTQERSWIKIFFGDRLCFQAKSTDRCLCVSLCACHCSSIFLCVLSVQPFTRQFLLKYHQIFRKNAMSNKLLDSFYSWDNVSKVNKKISTFSGANQNWVLHVISFFNFNINSRNFHFKKTRNLTQN